jgi:hypothetical protein
MLKDAGAKHMLIELYEHKLVLRGRQLINALMFATVSIQQHYFTTKT